jgi:hypothetical protein
MQGIGDTFLFCFRRAILIDAFAHGNFRVELTDFAYGTSHRFYLMKDIRALFLGRRNGFFEPLNLTLNTIEAMDDIFGIHNRHTIYP